MNLMWMWTFMLLFCAAMSYVFCITDNTGGKRWGGGDIVYFFISIAFLIALLFSWFLFLLIKVICAF